VQIDLAITVSSAVRRLSLKDPELRVLTGPLKRTSRKWHQTLWDFTHWLQVVSY